MSELRLICHEEDCSALCRQMWSYVMPDSAGAVIRIGPGSPMACSAGHASHACTCRGAEQLAGLEFLSSEIGNKALKARAERAEAELALTREVFSAYKAKKEGDAE